MKLNHLLSKLGLEEQLSEVEICDIVSDSRQARSGVAFFLLDRASEDHARQALDNKAIVFHNRDLDFGFKVEDVNKALSEALQMFYCKSFDSLKIYGVTGTNGKTSFSFMLKSLLDSYSVPTGIFGTIKNSFKDSVLNTGLTSPVATDFYRFNQENYNKGMRAVVCEVSSHALDQKRLGLNFLDGSAFTSFSQDHLDYHKDMNSYLQAKAKICTESLKSGGFVIGHKSVEEFDSFKCSNKIVINNSKYTFNIISSSIDGILFEFFKENKRLKGVLPVLGDFNVENFVLALVCLCEHFGGDFFPDERVFKSFKQIPGRMERIDLLNGSMAFIDFSHTPDSLEKALRTLKKYKNNKNLVVVFGCGGDRDKLKRPKMGQTAVSCADEVIITSDNPRYEDPKSIILDIVTPLKKDSFLVKEDRADAISWALDKSLKEPTILLIAGKGHEPYQDVSGVKRDFLDKNQVLNWLAKNKDFS